MTHAHAKNLLSVGQKFGKLTVIGETQKGFIQVRCDCGFEKRVTTGNLRAGNAQSCGYRCPIRHHGREDSVQEGAVFSNLTVVRMITPRKVLVRCVCGKEFEKEAWYLIRGETKSCGCKYRKFKVGDMINGRVIVETGTKHRIPKVKCLGCGKISRVAAWDDAKCRNCAPWDTRMKNGYVYGIVCPIALEIVYVGSTKGPPYRRVRDHFSERNAADNKEKPLYIWMRELARNGHMPGCIQLEHVETGNLHKREVFWIQKMTSEGCTLLNHEHNSKES